VTHFCNIVHFIKCFDVRSHFCNVSVVLLYNECLPIFVPDELEVLTAVDVALLGVLSYVPKDKALIDFFNLSNVFDNDHNVIHFTIYSDLLDDFLLFLAMDSERNVLFFKGIIKLKCPNMVIVVEDSIVIV